MSTPAARIPTRRAAALPARAGALWRFSRPHTIIGTTASVIALYLVVVDALPRATLTGGLADLGWTLLAGFCVNVYIVGINQLEDVAIDRVNKPFLPLASGELTPGAARRIVAACAAVPVALALTQGAVEVVAVLAGLAVGTAYSVPPVRLKRFPVLASLSITGVRAIVVNLGVALHFTRSLGEGSWAVPPAVWALTAFVVPFAFAIAVLKDVPDAEGDRRHRIATFTVRAGARPVLAAGLAALTLAYAGMALAALMGLDGVQPAVLVGGQLLALAVLWRGRARTDPDDAASVTGFYMLVWKAFFAEYALVALAALLG